jgi:hypothetical protein
MFYFEAYTPIFETYIPSSNIHPFGNNELSVDFESWSCFLQSTPTNILHNVILKLQQFTKFKLHCASLNFEVPLFSGEAPATLFNCNPCFWAPVSAFQSTILWNCRRHTHLKLTTTTILLLLLLPQLTTTTTTTTTILL